PPIGLLAALDLPLDIEPPHGLSRLEPERFEWDLNLGDPSLVRNARGRVPDAVPVEAQAFTIVRHLPVRPCARRIDLKEETVSVIEEGVEDDRDSIIDIEIRVARQLGRDDAVRRSVMTDDRDVQRGVVVQ